MQYQYQDRHSGAQFSLSVNEPSLQNYDPKGQGLEPLHYFIVWNRGKDQQIEVDGIQLTIPNNTFLVFNEDKLFRIQDSTNLVIWRYNSAFYCIVQHDAEVSCTGVLFYSSFETEPIIPDAKQTQMLGLLIEIFVDEFGTHDNIQGEMLRMLLKRLIIKLTRLVKNQTKLGDLGTTDLFIVRQYHMLVERHYKEKHQVKDYAVLLHKSPKTLSNLFMKYSKTGPLQVIQNRIFLESKRLLIYTEATSAEISHTLGFTEPAHFSRFFKNIAGVTSGDFRKLNARHA